MAAAPKLGKPNEFHLRLWRKCPNSATVTMHLGMTLTVKLCFLEGLAILVSKALVFVPNWICRVGMVI